MEKKIMDDIRAVDDVDVDTEIRSMPDLEIRAQDETPSDYENILKNEEKEKQETSRIQFLKERLSQAKADDPRIWTLEQTQEHFKNNPVKDPQEEGYRKYLLDSKRMEVKTTADQIKQMEDSERLRQYIQPGIYQDIGLSRPPNEKEIAHMDAVIKKREWDLTPPYAKGDYIMSKVAGKALPYLITAPAAEIFWPWMAAFEGINQAKNVAVPLIKGEGKEGISVLEDRRATELLEPLMGTIPEKGQKLPEYPPQLRMVSPVNGLIYDAGKWAVENPRKAVSIGASLGEIMLDYFIVKKGFDVASDIKAVNDPELINAFKALGLKQNATTKEAETAYRNIALQTHPDRGGSAEDFDTAAQAIEKIRSYRTNLVRKVVDYFKGERPPVQTPAKVLSSKTGAADLIPGEAGEPLNIKPPEIKPEAVPAIAQEVSGMKWEFGAEPAAAVPGEPIAFLGGIDKPKAQIIFDESSDNQPLGFKVSLPDGSTLPNPGSGQLGGSPYFNTMEEAQRSAESHFLKADIDTMKQHLIDQRAELEWSGAPKESIDLIKDSPGGRRLDDLYSKFHAVQEQQFQQTLNTKQSKPEKILTSPELPASFIKSTPELKIPIVKEIYSIDDPVKIREIITQDPDIKVAEQIYEQDTKNPLQFKVITNPKDPSSPDYYKKYFDATNRPEIKPSEKPEAIILMGLPGSNKSQFLKDHGYKNKVVIVDNDEAKEFHPIYIKDKRRAAFVQNESDQMSKLLLKQAVEQRKSVAIPKIGKSVKSLQSILEMLEKEGYSLTFIRTDIPKTESLRRVTKRFFETGRYVPVSYVDNINPLQIEAAYDTLKSGHTHMSLDTNVPFGQKAITLEGEAHGQREINQGTGELSGSGREEYSGTLPWAARTEPGTPAKVDQGTPGPGQETQHKALKPEQAYDLLSPEERASFELEIDNLRKTPEGNLFVAVKQLGGIAPYKDKFLSEEYFDIPRQLKNKNSSYTLDKIVIALKKFGWNFEDDESLRQELIFQGQHPVEKVSRSLLKGIIREAEKNRNLQAKVEEAFGKRRKFITTIRESERTAPEVAQAVESRYTPISNQQTMDQAKELVDRDYNAAVELVEGPSRADTFHNAVGQLLISRAQAEGRIADAIRLVERMAEKQTELGQAIQALSMYNRLTPDGILQLAQKTIRRAQQSIPQSKEKLLNYEKLAKGLDEKGREEIAKKLGIPVLTEQKASEIVEHAKKIQAMPDGREKDIETALMLKKITDLVPRTLSEKISMVQTMMQLLNPKTAIRNLLGNIGFMAAENMSETLATALDVGASLFTGKRTVYLPDLKAQAQGMAQGWKEGVEEATKGISLKNSQSKYTLPKNGVFDKGVMGALEKVLRIELSATDRAFYQSAFNQSIMQQCRASGVADPSEEMIERAHLAGLYRTFQDDNAISNFLVKMKQLFNVGKKWGFGDMVIKYPKTPGALLDRGIEYSPFGFIKTIVNLQKIFMGQEEAQEGFARSASRALIGSSLLVGTGAILAGMGIISGKRSKDKDVRAARENVGLRDYQINVSALKRFTMSGFDPEQAEIREDDILMSYDWFQPGSVSLALGANMVLDPKTSLPDKALNLGDSLLSASETLQEQPVLRGVRILTQKENIASGLGDLAKDIPQSFFPTLLNQIRQLTDNVVRNTRGVNLFQESYNRVISKIPIASKTLPPQITPRGEEREAYQLGSNNPFNVFLNPAFVNKYHPDPVSQMVLDIWENTGETIQFPRVAQAKIKLAGTPEPVQLTPDQYTEFQKYIGRKTDVLFSTLADNKNFMSLNDEKKAKMLQGYLTDINTAAKIEILGYRPKKYSNDVITIIKQIGQDKREIDNAQEDIRSVDDQP